MVKSDLDLTQKGHPPCPHPTVSIRDVSVTVPAHYVYKKFTRVRTGARTRACTLARSMKSSPVPEGALADDF